jgi:hypothetical protein
MTEVVEVITQTNTVEVIGTGAAVVEVVTDAVRVVEVLGAGPQGVAGADGVIGADGAPGLILSPTIPAFTDIDDAALATLTESNAVTVAGDAETVWPAVVRGDGNPELRVNAGAWGPSGIFRAGDSLRLRLLSAALNGTARTATLYAQGVAAAWVVMTPFLPLFIPAGSDSLITSDGETFRVKDE